MSGDGNNFSEEYLEETMGDLDGVDLEKLRGDLEAVGVDAASDGNVHRLFSEAASASEESEVPEIPSAAMALFEEKRAEAFARVAEEEAELDRSIASKSEDSKSVRKERSAFFRLPVQLGLLGAAAAVAVAFVWQQGKNGQAPNVTYAQSVTVLTPGEATGFAEPVFTWKADNGGAVDVTVVDGESGNEVASVELAYSPLRWSSLSDRAALEPGRGYEVRLSSGGERLSERAFRTLDSAADAPEPEATIEGIIEQCENLIAENRPADAWMLWAELTGEQKAHPKMQELKTMILQQIAS